MLCATPSVAKSTLRDASRHPTRLPLTKKMYPHWSIVAVEAIGYPLLPAVVVNFAKLGLASDEVHSDSDDARHSENQQVLCLLPLGALVCVPDGRLESFDAKVIRRNVAGMRKQRRARGVTQESVEEGIRMGLRYIRAKPKVKEIIEDIKRLVKENETDGDEGGPGGAQVEVNDPMEVSTTSSSDTESSEDDSE